MIGNEFKFRPFRRQSPSYWVFFPEKWSESGRRRLRFFLILSHALLCFSGCSVYMAAHQPKKKDLSVLERGTPRSFVVAELGAPATTDRDKRGNRYDFFLVTQGYSKGSRLGRAFAHGAADLFTIGCWEVIGTPTELAFDGTQLRIQVTYSDRDLVDVATVISKNGSRAIANTRKADYAASETGGDPYEASEANGNPSSEMRAGPVRSSRKIASTDQSSPKPAPQPSSMSKIAKGSFSTSCDQLATSLLAGAKSSFRKKREGSIRVAVYNFLPREERGAKDSALGERITSELERALVGQAGVQLVTRKNLSDIQSEQKLNEANWNQISQKQRQFGVVDVDLILRGNYVISTAGTNVRVECELLDPSSGVIVGAAQASVEIAQQD